MAAKLSTTYKCDSCGRTVTYSGDVDMYGDLTLVLPPGWGEYILPDPNVIENVLELCPSCVDRYRGEGKVVETHPEYEVNFRSIFDKRESPPDIDDPEYSTWMAEQEEMGDYYSTE